MYLHPSSFSIAYLSISVLLFLSVCPFLSISNVSLCLGINQLFSQKHTISSQCT